MCAQEIANQGGNRGGEYAHRHLAEVGVAWQFQAEDRSVLAAGFRELAAQLGALGVADTRDPVDL